MRKKLKVFAVASIGGHWVQLLRIAKALEKEFDVVYMSLMKNVQLWLKEESITQ